jgi:hypothetical protein
MSTIENQIMVDHEWNSEFKYINPRLQCQIPVSCKEMRSEYTVFQYSPVLYLIYIYDTNDYIVVPLLDQSSTLLHVHIIEHLFLDIDLDECSEVVNGIQFVCIFNNRILEISVETSFFQHLGDQKVGFSLKGFTEFSFNTTHTELLSFTINQNERTENLICCSVLGQQVELFQLNLLGNDGCRFNVIKETVFIFPPTIKVMKIYCNSNFFLLHSKLQSTQFQIYIYVGKSNERDDEACPIFILKKCERCILATSDQLDRFQIIGFQIVGTMYIPSHDHEKKSEIQTMMKELLKLNEY